MTASKFWALIVGLVIVGTGLVGAVFHYRAHPDGSQIARLVQPAVPTPAPPVPASKPVIPPETPPEAAQAPDGKTPDTAKEAPKPTDPEPPHFDVVRVEPTGEAVLAGKGDPNSKVALMASGKVVAEAKADPNGNFVILPPPLQPGDHDLSLRETPEGKPPVESKQNVAVSVPRKPGDQVVVALAEPGKPTKLLSGTPEAKSQGAGLASEPKQAGEQEQAKPDDAQIAVAKPETKVQPLGDVGLAIRSVELEHGDGLFASGVAVPGTKIEVYLNGSHLAQVVAGTDRQWTVTVKKGLAGGHYAVRADAIGGGGGVAARVEVPFDVPTAMAAETKPAAPAPESSTLGRPADKQVAETPAPAPEDTAPSAAPDGKVIASEPSRSEADKEPSTVPIPRPDVAARAKAAVAEAPSKAPATLAAAPPAAPETRTAMSPAETPVAPAKSASAPPTLASAAPASGSSSNAVINQVETALVVRGDNLWDISRIRLGNPMRYTQIYTSNASQIRDPNLIYPGQVFVMPQP